MTEKNPTPVENANGQSASVPPAEPLAPQATGPSSVETSSSDEAEGDTVLVKLEGPFTTSEFRLPLEDGGTLVVDSQGTRVPSEDVADLLARAARSGVLLSTEASD